HSRGAFTTTGLVATYTGKFSCAGHTSGGIAKLPGYSAPTAALAAQITCPYIIHHGDSDAVVPVIQDSALNKVFDSTAIDHRFYVYHGYSHSQMSMDSLMFERTKDWFLAHSCIAASVNNLPGSSTLHCFPVPANQYFTVRMDETKFDFEL